MKDVEPVNALLEKIAQKHETSISAVALNYDMCKWITPAVGVRKLEQAVENCKALGWRLTTEEIEEIDGVSFQGYATALCQQG